MKHSFSIVFDIFVPCYLFVDRPIHTPSFITHQRDEKLASTAACCWAIDKVKAKLKSFGISKNAISSLGFEPKFIKFDYDEHNKNSFYSTGWAFYIIVSGPPEILCKIPHI